MQLTNLPAGGSSQKCQRYEANQPKGSSHPPFSDYLSAYRQAIEAVEPLPSKQLSPEIIAAAEASNVILLTLMSLNIAKSHPLWQLRQIQDITVEASQHLDLQNLPKCRADLCDAIEEVSQAASRIILAVAGSVSTKEVVDPLLQTAKTAKQSLNQKTLSDTTELMDFIDKLRVATDVILTLKLEGIDKLWSELQHPFKPAVVRRRMMESMEITNAVCNGVKIKIGVPKAVNRWYGAKPIDIGDVQKSVSQEDECVLGSHARRFVKSVDWNRRMIVFKGKSRPKVTLPHESDGAWKYMKALFTSDHPQGWVKLGNDLDARWSGHFDRRDANGEVDTENPLTNLRCRIESNRKRGRRRLRETNEEAIPMIRLVAFDKTRFDDLVKKQNDAKNLPK